MGALLPDNALLADLVPPGLKLGLDQAEYLPRLLQELLNGRQNDFQRDEAHIHHGQIQWLPQLLGRHIADIGLFHNHNSGIRTDFPIQLTITHINGKDLFRSLLQQAVCKTAGRSAGVAAHEALRFDPKIPQSLFQLQSAPAHIGARRPPDLNGHGLFVGRTGLVRFLAVHIYNAAHNDGLRLGAVFRISLLCQEHIQSLFHLHLGITPLTNSAIAPLSRPHSL